MKTDRKIYKMQAKPQEKHIRSYFYMLPENLDMSIKMQIFWGTIIDWKIF